MAGGPTLSQLLREAKEEAERVKDEVIITRFILKKKWVL